MLASEPYDHLDAVLAAYRLRRLAEPVAIEVGTLNRNWRVETDRGPVFARRHRTERPAERIRFEHALIGWAGERGIPVARALERSDGETVTEVGGALWALFPWVDGDLAGRGSLTVEQAGALGEMHGRVQRTLEPHPASAGPRFEVTWDAEASLAAHAAVGRAAAAAGAPDPPEAALEALELQASLLRAGRSRPPSDLNWLPWHLQHGDYHDEQVLFDESGAIVAVTDWENARPTSRAWEVLRSLSFSRLTEGPLLEAYLGGYASQVRVPEAEWRAAVELWWQLRLHTTWVFTSYFLDGNERVAAFFPDTLRHLRDLADEDWRGAFADRIVAAAGNPHPPTSSPTSRARGSQRRNE